MCIFGRERYVGKSELGLGSNVCLHSRPFASTGTGVVGRRELDKILLVTENPPTV